MPGPPWSGPRSPSDAACSRAPGGASGPRCGPSCTCCGRSVICATLETPQPGQSISSIWLTVIGGGLGSPPRPGRDTVSSTTTHGSGWSRSTWTIASWPRRRSRSSGRARIRRAGFAGSRTRRRATHAARRRRHGWRSSSGTVRSPSAGWTGSTRRCEPTKASIRTGSKRAGSTQPSGATTRARRSRRSACWVAPTPRPPRRPPRSACSRAIGCGASRRRSSRSGSARSCAIRSQARKPSAGSSRTPTDSSPRRSIRRRVSFTGGGVGSYDGSTTIDQAATVQMFAMRALAGA